jgi:hypothetical protein
MSNLTDPQLVMLSAAAQRDDHVVVLPKTLKGGAATKVVKTSGAGPFPATAFA